MLQTRPSWPGAARALAAAAALAWALALPTTPAWAAEPAGAAAPTQAKTKPRPAPAKRPGTKPGAAASPANAPAAAIAPAPAIAPVPALAPTAAPGAAPNPAAAAAAAEAAPAETAAPNGFKPYARIQGGPTAPVLAVAWSPDGRLLALASGHQVRLWDARRGYDLGVLGAHDEVVQSLAFTPDGKRLASGGADMQIRIWDVASSEEVAKAQSGVGWPLQLAYSPDGKLLAIGGFKLALVYDTGTGTLRHTLQVVDSGAVSGLQFSPDSQRLATRSALGIKLWSMADGKALASFTPTAGQVLHALSPDFTQVVRSERSLLSLVLVDGLQVMASVQAAGVSQVVFSADGRRVAWAQADGQTSVWTVQAGATTRMAQDKPVAVSDQNPIHDIAFAPDGLLLASGNDDETARVWDMQGKLLSSAAGRGQKITGVVYSRDGSTLAVMRADGSAALVDTASGRATPLRDKPAKGSAGGTALPPPPPAAAASAAGDAAAARSIWTPGRLIDVAPDGRTVAAVSGGQLRLYGRSTGNEVATLGPVAPKDLRYTPDGRWLMVLEDTQIQVFDAVARYRVQQVPLAAHNASTLALMFDAKGSTLWLWHDTETPRAFALEARSIGVNGLEPPRTLALPGVPAKLEPDAALAATLSPDGQWLALSDGETTRIHAMDGGQLVQTLTDLPWYATTAFTPDGKTLLAYGGGVPGHQVLRWDVRSGKALDALDGHSANVNAVAVSPSGLHLTSGADDRTLRLWQSRDGSPALVVGLLGEQGWVAVSADGHFDAAPAGAEELLLVRQGADWLDVAPVAAHRQRLHKPELLRRALAAER
jgi:WD40 repeat protein